MDLFETFNNENEILYLIDINAFPGFKIKEINDTPAGGGAKITIDSALTTNEKISTAIQDFTDRCKALPGAETEIQDETKGDKKNITCVLKSCKKDIGYTLSDNKKTCIKTTNYSEGESCLDLIKDKFAETAKWNSTSNTCEITACQKKQGYDLDKANNKCIKQKQAQRAEKKLAQEYNDDIDKLIEAYNDTVQKLTQQCEENEKKIENWVCNTDED